MSLAADAQVAPAAPPARGERTLRRPTRLSLSALCVVFGVIALIPLVWTLSLSIRTSGDVFSDRLLPHTFRIANFSDAWSQYLKQSLWSLITKGTGKPTPKDSKKKAAKA